MSPAPGWPIIPELFSILGYAYFSQNYSGIISSSLLQRDVELLVPGDLHWLLWVLIIVSNPLGGLIAVAGVSVL